MDIDIIKGIDVNQRNDAEEAWEPIFYPKGFISENPNPTLEQFRLDINDFAKYGIQIS